MPRLSLVLGCLAGALFAVDGQAEGVRVSGFAQAGVPGEGVVEQTFQDEPADGPAVGNAEATAQRPGDTVFAASSTEARAELGVLEVTATSAAAGGTFFQFPLPGAIATGIANPILEFEDTIRFLAPDPSLSFQRGTAVLRLVLSGRSEASGSGALTGDGGRVEHNISIGLGGCMDCFDGVSGILFASASGFTEQGELPPLVFESRPLGFWFDQFVTLRVSYSAIVTAIANSPDPEVSQALLEGRLSWGGVIDLRADSAEGSLSCDVESLSGIDWCQTVPEASGAGLALAAVLSLGAMARLRRRLPGTSRSWPASSASAIARRRRRTRGF